MRCGWSFEIGWGGLHSRIIVPNARRNWRAEREIGKASNADSI